MSEKLTPPELKAAAAAVRKSALPRKSEAKYEKAYAAFLAWCKRKDVPEGHFSVNVLLAYFQEENQSKAPTTLWTTYSKLKKTLLANDAVNIDEKPFKAVKEQLRSYGVDYQPKESKLFLLDEIYTFVRTADDRDYLAMKVIALIGMIGALRHGELYNLETNDVLDRGTELLIKIRSTTAKWEKAFIVQQHPEAAIDPVTMYRRYVALRPALDKLAKARIDVSPYIFLRYGNGRCTSQRIGKHTIAAVPAKIAAFLSLPTPENYTGHAFRRTGATNAVNNGADLLQLKALGDWKSDSVAQGYLEDSDPARRKRAAMVQGLPAAKELRIELPPTATQPVFNITGCTNVHIHYIVHAAAGGSTPAGPQAEK